MSSKIKEIEFSILTAPDEKRPHWVSLFKVPSANELLVRMKTDDGVEGFGLATSYTDITPLVNVVKGGLSDEILGMDALSPEGLYEKLFGLTFSRKAAENSWGREAWFSALFLSRARLCSLVGTNSQSPSFRMKFRPRQSLDFA